MMTLRTFDARMLMAQRQGKTSFYIQHMAKRRDGARLEDIAGTIHAHPTQSELSRKRH